MSWCRSQLRWLKSRGAVSYSWKLSRVKTFANWRTVQNFHGMPLLTWAIQTTPQTSRGKTFANRQKNCESFTLESFQLYGNSSAASESGHETRAGMRDHY